MPAGFSQTQKTFHSPNRSAIRTKSTQDFIEEPSQRRFIPGLLQLKILFRKRRSAIKLLRPRLRAIAVQKELGKGGTLQRIRGIEALGQQPRERQHLRPLIAMHDGACGLARSVEDEPGRLLLDSQL